MREMFDHEPTAMERLFEGKLESHGGVRTHRPPTTLSDYQGLAAEAAGRAAVSKARGLLRETARQEGQEPDPQSQAVAREMAAAIIDEAQAKADAATEEVLG